MFLFLLDHVYEWKYYSHCNVTAVVFFPVLFTKGMYWRRWCKAYIHNNHFLNHVTYHAAMCIEFIVDSYFCSSWPEQWADQLCRQMGRGGGVMLRHPRASSCCFVFHVEWQITRAKPLHRAALGLFIFARDSVTVTPNSHTDYICLSFHFSQSLCFRPLHPPHSPSFSHFLLSIALQSFSLYSSDLVKEY